MTIPPRPTAPAPWSPNESPALDAVISQLQRSMVTIETVKADITAGLSSTFWKGPDAEQLHREWMSQRAQLESLGAQIRSVIAAMQGQASSETARYRQQQTSAKRV